MTNLLKDEKKINQTNRVNQTASVEKNQSKPQEQQLTLQYQNNMDSQPQTMDQILAKAK